MGLLQLWRLIALPVLLGFLLLGGYLYFYLGGNKDVLIERVQLGEMTLVYKIHRGAYHKINPVIESVEAWAKSSGVPCPRTFGEYLDNPMEVAEERLTSHGGCILEAPVETATLPAGFEKRTLPPAAYIHATFEGSPAIGPWRVYPKLNDYKAEKGLRAATSTLEIYTLLPAGGMKTEYLVPILDPGQ